MKEAYNVLVKDDAPRIEALKKYDILDTPPDGSFDRITRLAAELLNVPIAIVSLVDTDRIWFKSRYGIDAIQIDRDPGLCASAILSNEIYLVEDALSDPRTLANPLVAGQFGLRFYAAVPLTVKEGYNLGTLCVIDKKPRHLNESEKKILQHLADVLIDQIELRLAARTAKYQQNQLLSIAAHELKNPLTIIPIWAELIQQRKEDHPAIDKMCNQIRNAGNKMTRIINEMLEAAKMEANNISLRFERLDLAEVVKQVVDSNQDLANNKNQGLQLKLEARPEVLGDETRLQEITNNLVNNAIKYSPENKKITVTLRSKNKKAIIEVEDEGPGLTNEDKKKLFLPFTRLSAQPTGGENSTGLGLSIVKVLVEAHHGKISAVSDGVDKGSKFCVSIPLAE